MIVADYAELRTIDPTAHLAATVADDFRGGLFLPREISCLPAWASARMALDTEEGMYVASTFAPDWVWVRKYDGLPNVNMFGALPYYAHDSGPAIQCAIDVIGWGKLEVPVGNFKSCQTLYTPPGFTMVGHGVQHTPNIAWGEMRGSVLIGSHTGPAVLSMKGAYNSSLQDICLFADEVARPKTVLALGRGPGGGTAGRHHIQNVNLLGYPEKAVVYSIASEENNFVSLRANVLPGAAAKHTVFTSEHDELAVDSMVSSSNFTSYMSGFNLLHQGTTDDSDVFYQSLGSQSQTWSLRDGFMHMTSGARSYFVRLNLTDTNPLGDFNFDSIGFEAANSAAPPLATFKIEGNGRLYGFKAKNVSEGMHQQGTEKFIDVSPTVTLVRPEISVSKASHPSTFGPVEGGSIRLPAVYGNVVPGGVPGLRDMTLDVYSRYTHTVPFTYFVEIQAGNTFRWIGNPTGGTPYAAENVPINGNWQPLSHGVRIKFGAIGGHTPGSFWYWTATPAIG